MSDDRWTRHDIDGKGTLHAIGLEVNEDSFLGEVAAELRRRSNEAAAKVAPDLTLPIAPERSDGGPCCADCAPIRGERAPYQQDFNAAPLLMSDPLNPAVGTCPQCGKAWMVPAHIAITRLSALVTLLLRDLTNGNSVSTRSWTEHERLDVRQTR